MGQEPSKLPKLGSEDRNGSVSTASYGSDVVVEMLRALDIQYVAFNPGASFRGLHDSLNHFEPRGIPEDILCTHEEIAVAVAHGYAMVTGKPAAAIVHNIVGLQHASMAIFNAWCDRAPVIVLGATGPTNTENRRPWIDWVHTALVQGNQVRDYTKWDDQPGSVEAIPESMLRGYRIAMTEPKGPVYICFDADIQEQRIEQPLEIPNTLRFAPPRSPAAEPESLRALADLLIEAQWPVIVADGLDRQPDAREALVDLANEFAIPIINGAGSSSFPNTNSLDLTEANAQVLERADLILALNAQDLETNLGGMITRNRRYSMPVGKTVTVAHITQGDLLQTAWAIDSGRLMPVDIPITADTELAVPELAAQCKVSSGRSQTLIDTRRKEAQAIRNSIDQENNTWKQQGWDGSPISSQRLYSDLWDLVKDQPFSLLHGHLGIARRIWEFTEPDQWIAGGRGGGVGHSIGFSMGATLALKNSGRLCIDVQGDGDLLYTTSGLWTASHLDLPLLIIIFNNRSYYQDEGHQAYMAESRERQNPDPTRGIHIRNPDTDFVALAGAFGIKGFGPVTEPSDLRSVLADAIKVVRDEGRPALVDVISQPR